jgi:imidazole glycerol-phosphate synthase subunit HisH
MLRVVVVDLGMGNLRSVERALLRAAADRGLRIEVVRTNKPDDVRSGDKIVFPGQGAFRDCALALTNGMGETLREVIAQGKPYLGICLGLQVLFDSSDEAPNLSGLGIFRGHVAKLETGSGDEAVKIPHMGWNDLSIAEPRPGLFRDWPYERPCVYFVHSYHALAEDPSIVVATATHGRNNVTAAVCRDNVFAVQFHPEKSQSVGLELLGGFLAQG